ncbi:MAG: hypothetical protein ACKO0Z_07230 [Betaproteobacteria bacterium]
MGLKATIRKAGTDAISAIGDIASDIQYYSVALGSYNAVTDSQTRVETRLDIKGLVYKAKEETQDYKKTELHQKNVLVAGEALGTTKITEDDYMIIDGVKHEIKSFKEAPQRAVVIFTVREV